MVNVHGENKDYDYMIKFKEIIEQLKELNKQGITIIYTSHHLEEAENFCTDIAIIDYGKILIQGSPKNLIAQNTNAKNLEDVFLNLTKRNLRD